jgi:hypothetical protein
MTILDIRTDFILDSDVWGVRHPSGVSIRPSCNDPWTLLTVSVLVNELDATWRHLSRSRARSRARRNASPGISIPFVVQCSNTIVNRWIQVKIFTGVWTFEVEASWQWITGEWKREKILRQSQYGFRWDSTLRLINDPMLSIKMRIDGIITTTMTLSLGKKTNIHADRTPSLSKKATSAIYHNASNHFFSLEFENSIEKCGRSPSCDKSFNLPISGTKFSGIFHSGLRFWDIF